MPTLLTLDTCVLMHSFTRNLLLRLAKAGYCLPIWSDEIGREWLRNAPRIWKVSPDIVQTEWENMQTNFAQANMGTVIVDELLFKKIDKKDRHVAMSALMAQQKFNLSSSVLLTWNTQDFHKKTLRDVGIQLITPDQYLSSLWTEHKKTLIDYFHQGLAEHIALGRPEYSIIELLKRDKLYRLAKLYAAS